MTKHTYMALFSHVDAETFPASGFLEAATVAEKLAKSKGHALGQYFNRVVQVIETYPTIPAQHNTPRSYPQASNQADMPMASQLDR